MKKSKRLAILALCLAMMVGIAACASDTTTTTTEPATTQPAATEPAATQPAATEPAPPDRIQLVFTLWGDVAELETTQVALDLYNSLQDRVFVTALQIPRDEYADVIQTMAAGGNSPDCGMVAEDTAIGWARRGLLLPIDIYEGQADRPLDYLNFRDGGRTVATSAANEVLAIWFNRDMFDAAGVPYPPTTLDTAWTWDEFIDVAKQLTFDANGNTPNDAGFDKNNIVQYGAYVNQYTWQLEVWALSNGGKWFSEDGQQIIFDDPAIEAMQKVLDLHLVHNVAPFNPGTNDDGFASSVGAGNVAMCTEGQWAVGFAGVGFDVNYGVAVLPYMQRKANIVTGGPVGVWAGTQHPEEVAEFLRWYTDPNNNFGTIEAGWWMPTLGSWYTDESLLKKWIDDVPLRARLPADAYRTAIKDVALDLSVTQSTGWYYTPNTFEVLNRVLGPALVEAVNGSKTVAQVIEEVRPAMEAALAG